MFKMRLISAALFSTLISTAVSAHSKVKEIRKRVFFGEDVYIDIPSGNVSEVVFKPSANQSAEVVILRAGQLVSSYGSINSLGHLVLEDVQESDEGLYIVKNTSNPSAAQHLTLYVRECALEHVVKYGETYTIPLNHIEGPITLMFRPRLDQGNLTLMHRLTMTPPLVMYNQTTVLAAEYAGRLIVSEKRVMLHSVRMADEGSYMVLDRDGKIQRRNCLIVREHQNFLHLTYGENVKMKLYIDHSNVTIVYRPKSDNMDRMIVDQGVVVAPVDPLLEGRLIVEGSELIMKKVQVADIGVFKVTDLAGFPVAHIYIEVDEYKLPPLTVAILSMLGLVASMLLLCLLSCLYKVHKRNEKNKKLVLLAQQAGKGDGEAFREVVHEAYRRFTEESLMESVSDKPSESTDVVIKGLETSKPGQYHSLLSENLLEMSDSGAEFVTSPLPLDSDTDAAMTDASHRPLLNAISPTAEIGLAHCKNIPEVGRTSDSALSASPTSNYQSVTAVNLNEGTASPGTASRGSIGSDLGKTEGNAEQKGEAAQST